MKDVRFISLAGTEYALLLQSGDETDDEGLEYASADEALREAAIAALAIAADLVDGHPEEVTFDVSSDKGPVGKVTVRLSVSKA